MSNSREHLLTGQSHARIIKVRRANARRSYLGGDERRLSPSPTKCRANWRAMRVDGMTSGTARLISWPVISPWIRRPASCAMRCARVHPRTAPLMKVSMKKLLPPDAVPSADRDQICIAAGGRAGPSTYPDQRPHGRYRRSWGFPATAHRFRDPRRRRFRGRSGASLLVGERHQKSAALMQKSRVIIHRVVGLRPRDPRIRDPRLGYAAAPLKAEPGISPVAMWMRMIHEKRCIEGCASGRCASAAM
jgi:hypothetical protein